MGDAVDEEWTVVSKKFQRDKKLSRSSASVRDSSTQDPSAMNKLKSGLLHAEQPSESKIENLRLEILNCLPRWRETGCRKALVSEILRRLSKSPNVEVSGESDDVTSKYHPIETAVCAGLGSFEIVEDHRRTIWQLCSFLDIVDILQMKRLTIKATTASEDSKEINKLASDPCMTALDKAVLASFGFKVVDPITDEGKEAVKGAMEGQHVFLFAPFVPWFALYPDIFAIGHLNDAAPTVHRPRLCISSSVLDTVSLLEDLAKKPKQDRARRPRRNDNPAKKTMEELDWDPLQMHNRPQSPEVMRRVYKIATLLLEYMDGQAWRMLDFELHSTTFLGLQVAGFQPASSTTCGILDD